MDLACLRAEGIGAHPGERDQREKSPGLGGSQGRRCHLGPGGLVGVGDLWESSRDGGSRARGRVGGKGACAVESFVQQGVEGRALRWQGDTAMDRGAAASQSFHSSESKNTRVTKGQNVTGSAERQTGRHLSQEWGRAASEHVAPTRGRASQAWEQRAQRLELSRVEGRGAG